jgi:transposase, IS30 family
MRLSFKERLVIEQEVAAGSGVREIARLLGRNHSVISRELEPDKDQGQLPYSAKRAELRAERKIRHGRKRKVDKDLLLRGFVVAGLTEDWSPEQIVGRLKEFPPRGLKNQSISVEAIYQFAYSGEWAGDGKLLCKHLRQAKPRRIRRYSRRPYKARIPERVSIHERPELVGYGHWETDTVFGRKNQPVSVQYEKKSQLVRIHKLANQSSQEYREAIQDTLELLPKEWKQTMTFDNGSENYEHNKLGLKTYFCDPYSAWQKGGVENMNKLIRQYIPKRFDVNKFTARQIKQIQERLNNRPRKGLQYKTPNEILAQSGAFVSRT